MTIGSAETKRTHSCHTLLSVRNIPDVKSAQVNEINVFDIMKYDSLLVTKAAVEKIQEVYA